MPAYGPTLIHDAVTPRAALVSAGYYAAVTTTQYNALQLMWPAAEVTKAQYDAIVAAVTKPQSVDAAVAALPSQIPLTVEGASEDFITSVMQQLLIRFDQDTNTINGNVVIMRDQVKTHVTSETDRVISTLE